MGCENHEDGIFCVAVLGGPDHGRYVESDCGIIEFDFGAVCTVVDDDGDASVNGNEELVTGAVCVFAADVSAGHVVDNEESFRIEGQGFAELSDGEVSAQIDRCGELLEGYALDGYRLKIGRAHV